MIFRSFITLYSHDIQESIRSFWRQTYERATAELFEDYIPAQVARVNAVRDGGDLPSDVLDLDFSPGYEKSRWNRLVLGRLYQQLIQSRADEGGWGLVDVSEEYVMGLLAGQLKRSRDAWAVHQPKFSQTTGRFENSAEATRRAEESRESVHSGKVLRSRRKAVSLAHYFLVNRLSNHSCRSSNAVPTL